MNKTKLLTVAGFREKIAIPYFGISSVEAVFDPEIVETQVSVENIEIYECQNEVRMSFGLPGNENNCSTAAIVDVSDDGFSVNTIARAYLVETQIVIGKQLVTAGVWLSQEPRSNEAIRLGTSAYSKYFSIDDENSFKLGKPQHSIMELIKQHHTKHCSRLN